MSIYCQVTYRERLRLYRGLLAGRSLGQIARELGRHRSTIYREVCRNGTQMLGYLPDRAAKRARQRRRLGRSKILRDMKLRLYVEAALLRGWSPEQIAGRMKREGCRFYACHETIYRYVYRPSRRRGRRRLYRYLTHAKPRRTARSHRRHRSGKFLHITLVGKRPEPINQRAWFGHWEGDTVQFLPSLATAHVTTMVERQTRFALVMKQPNKRTMTVMPAIKSALERLPIVATQTVTFDQGSEFADFRQLERRRKYRRRRIKTYFCNPRSPWQKGSVENFNRRLRRFLPKDLDIRTISQRKIGNIVARMNQTPRKCLAYQTPAEAFVQRCRASN